VTDKNDYLDGRRDGDVWASMEDKMVYVEVGWIESHKGCYGNELADRLAEVCFPAGCEGMEYWDEDDLVANSGDNSCYCR